MSNHQGRRSSSAVIVCVAFVASALLGSLATAAERPAPDKVWKLDWVDVRTRGCCCLFGGGAGDVIGVEPISSTPSPCGAAFSSAYNGSTKSYSRMFRPNDQDSQAFVGLSHSEFGGYRVGQYLRDVMARKPSALEKLEEFDRGVATGGTMHTIGLTADLVGLAAVITGIIIAPSPGGTKTLDFKSAGGVMFFGGLGGIVVGISLNSASEYVNAASFPRLIEAIDEFNGM